MADRLVKLACLFYAVAIVLGMLAGPRWTSLTLLPMAVPLVLSHLAWFGGVAAAARRQYRAGAACAVISLIALAVAVAVLASGERDLGLASAAYIASVVTLVVGVTVGLDDEDQDDELDLMA